MGEAKPGVASGVAPMAVRYFLWKSAARAGMAELADAADSKSAEGNLVGVRPPLPAPSSFPLSHFLLATYVRLEYAAE